MGELPWRWLRTATLASLLIPALVPAFAPAFAAIGANPAAALGPAEARAWLVRMQTAAHTANYQGTMVFSMGATMSSSRVAHYARGEQVWEHLEALDGRQERIVRHNDVVNTLWPQNRVAVVERRDPLTAWSTTPQRVEPRAIEQYDVRAEGNDRVAGREAAVFLLEPRDGLRYAQRLWSDAASGLLLRADVLDSNSPRMVLESTAFSEVAIGSKMPREGLSQRALDGVSLDGYRVVRPRRQQTTLEAEGWSLSQAVPGFRLVGCVRRGMGLMGDEDPVLQAAFTDGLTVVSLFIELFKPERHRSEAKAQQGATATWMLRRGEHWIVAVGDVPLATLQQFVQALDRRKP